MKKHNPGEPGRCNRLYAGTTLAGALMCAGQVAAAGTDGAATNPPVARVVVEGRAGQPVDTTRQVVRRADLERYGDSNLSDTLGRISGVTVDRSKAKGPVLQLRGLGAGYTQVLINGEPMPPNFSLDSIAPAMVERIEINRVPQADVSGQAIAGAINIVTRSAGSSARSELKLVTAHENGGPSANMTGQRAGALGPVTDYLLAAGLSRELFERPVSIHEEGRTADGGVALDRDTDRHSGNRMDGLNVLFNLKRRFEGGASLSWDSSANLRRTTGSSQDEVTTLTGAYPEFTSNDVGYSVRTGMQQSTLRWNQPLPGEGRLDLELGGRHTRRDSDADFAGLDEKRQLTLVRIVKSAATDRDLNLNGKLAWPLTKGQDLVMGWQASRNGRAEQRVQDDTVAGGRLPVNLDEAYDAQVRRLAVYLMDEWKFAPRGSLYVGVRWERLVTDTTGTGLDGVGNRSAVLTPTTQFRWGLPGRPDDLVRLSLGRSFKAPQTVELVPRRFLSNNNSQTNPDSIGNPALRPELARSIDLGYEHAPKHGPVMSLSAYWRRIQDVVVPTLFLQDGRWLSTLVNDGGATVRGVNAELRYRLKDAGAALPPLEFRANAERNWSRLDAVPFPANRLERQQPTSGALSVEYKAATWSGGANLNVTSGRYARISAVQAVGAGVRRALDAYALWPGVANGQVRLTVLNILQQGQAASSTYFADDLTLRQDTVSPGFRGVRLTYERKL